GLYVRADRGHTAAAKIGGPADLFLPAVLGLAGDGASTGRCAQHCGVEHDPRPGWLRSRADRCGLGEPAGSCGLASGHRNRWRLASSGRWRLLRVLNWPPGRGRPGLRDWGTLTVER